MYLNRSSFPRALAVAVVFAAMGTGTVAAGSVVLINGDGKLAGCETGAAVPPNGYAVDSFQMELADGGKGVGSSSITSNLQTRVGLLNAENCASPTIDVCAESKTTIESGLGQTIATIDQVMRLQSGYLWGLGSNGQMRYLLHHVVSGNTHVFKYYEPYSSADSSQVAGAFHINCGPGATSGCHPFSGWPSTLATTPADIPEIANGGAPVNLKWDQPDSTPWSSSSANDQYHYGYTLTLRATPPPSVLHSVSGYYHHQEASVVKRCTNATFPKQAIVNDTGPIRASPSFSGSIFDFWNAYETTSPTCVALSAMEDFPASMSQVQAKLWYGESEIELAQLVRETVTTSMTPDAASVLSANSVFEVDPESRAATPREVELCAAFVGPFSAAAVAVAEYEYLDGALTAKRDPNARLYISIGREKRSLTSKAVALLVDIAALLLALRLLQRRVSTGQSV
ncbi:MAG: hypothetical protein IPJ58_00410 [Ardenticatenia bacterium]|nr:hypothetical protein [Ardenticatenia bacterium]